MGQPTRLRTRRSVVPPPVRDLAHAQHSVSGLAGEPTRQLPIYRFRVGSHHRRAELVQPEDAVEHLVFDEVRCFRHQVLVKRA